MNTLATKLARDFRAAILVECQSEFSHFMRAHFMGLARGFGAMLRVMHPDSPEIGALEARIDAAAEVMHILVRGSRILCPGQGVRVFKDVTDAMYPNAPNGLIGYVVVSFAQYAAWLPSKGVSKQARQAASDLRLACMALAKEYPTDV